MVKIGEVEFLVRFDTVGKEFTNVLQDVLKDLDIGGEDIDERLAGIEGYLGMLVTPWSGSRVVDLRKSGAYLKQLESEEWIAEKVKSIASSETLLKYFGLEGAELGKEETEEAAREKFLPLTRDIAKFIEVAMSSEAAYNRGISTLVDITTLLSTSTEGNLAHLIEKVMRKVQVETHVDTAIFKWLEEEVKATVFVGQKHWDILKKEVGKEDKPLVDTYQKLMDKIGEAVKDEPKKEEILKRMFYGSPTALKDEAREIVEKLLSEVRISKGLALPKNIVRTIEELEGLEKQSLKLRSFALDLKFLLHEESDVNQLIERMGTALTDEEKEVLVERIEESISKFGYFFGFGESALIGGLRKLGKDMERLPESMRKEFFSGTYMGPVYGSFAEEVASTIPVADIGLSMEEKLPQKLVESLQVNLDVLENVSKFMKTIPDQVGERFKNQYDEVMKRLNRMHNG